MTRDEILARLTSIRDRAARAIELLEAKPLTSQAMAEIQHLASSLKNEIQAEYKRMVPERVQRSLTMFEISVYSPTIEEAWADTGISRSGRSCHRFRHRSTG
jgi:hypothetical protein